ncbi:MAG: MerR family transcriptional regulator [Firmicutes bacterium]|nr:MerR family transcriptional regulator [Bacillota bacterium]
MYSIGIAQQKTGLSARQIRYYEKMGLIQLKRTSGNQRRFSDEDIKLLLRIKELLSQNLDVKSVKEIISNEKETKTLSPIPELEKIKVFGTNLTSLYPVSDRAELVSLLNSMEIKEKPKEQDE